MTADVDDAHRWSEIGDAIKTLNAIYDGPAPISEINRIAEKHSAKPSDVLAVQRWHKEHGEIVLPDDVGPYVKPRLVDLAGLDHVDDLPHEAPDSLPAGSQMVACDRCGRRVRASGIGSHQRGNHCTPPQTAGPDTAVGASAPPAVTDAEPQPPADPIDVQWPESFARPGIAAAFGKTVAEEFAAEGINVLSDEAAEGLIDLAKELAQEVGIAPLTPDADSDPTWMELYDPSPTGEPDRANVDKALACVAEIAADHDTGPVAEASRRALAELHLLQDVIRDHHRQADLIAERAVLAARLAEIDAALGDCDAGHVNDDSLPAPRTHQSGHHRQPVTCECGAQVTQGGIGAHRTRSKAHAAWAATQDGAA